MKKIGLLSDTHGYWDNRYAEYFAACDEVWHAGDIGGLELADRFQKFKAFRAVYGNIDSSETRVVYPEYLRFQIEDVDVLMTHIGGYPGRYVPQVKKMMDIKPPMLFISGHSHILKVMFDKKYNCLHLNPGAAGIYGFHAVRTLMRFVVDGKEIKDLEVVELHRK